MITLTCIICGKEFLVSPYYAKRGQKCCSRTCGSIYRDKPIPWNKGMRGLHLSPLTEWKKGETPTNSKVFKKGLIPWNKGQDNGKSAWFYRDRILEYKALHKRINRKFKEVETCMFCGKKGCLHCANVSGEYRENLSDWMKLCVSCHMKYDRGILHE